MICETCEGEGYVRGQDAQNPGALVMLPCLKCNGSGVAGADARRAIRRLERFYATELGALYAAYSKATIDLWRHDADENFSLKRLGELTEIQTEKQRAFVAKLMELAGV